MSQSRILLTGGTGFTGGFVLRRLVEQGHSVTLFVRDLDKAKRRCAELGVSVPLAQGSFEEPASYDRALAGHEVLVNVASLGFGHAETVVGRAEAAGIRRAIFFSTTALFTTLPAETKVVRLAAEQCIQQSRLQWTILRPTMICGAVGDRNLTQLMGWVRRHRWLPVFGPGTYLLQPVYVDDLARATCQVLDQPKTYGQGYNLSGKDTITYNELVAMVGRALQRRTWVIHLPVGLSLVAVDLARRLPGLPRISREQVLRLNEDKAFDHGPAVRDFGYAPTPLAEFLARQAEQLRHG